MTLTEGERNAIVNSRIDKSKKTFEEAKGIIEMQYWNSAANRLYYSAYYMASALLIKNGYTAQTHAGVISMLGQHFVKTGLIHKDIGRLYSLLFELRQSGDYDDWRIMEEKDVVPMFEVCETFIQTIEKLIQQYNT